MQIFNQVLQKKLFLTESTLQRGCLDSSYQNKFAQIRDAITDQKIWVSIDETFNSARRITATISKYLIYSLYSHRILR